MGCVMIYCIMICFSLENMLDSCLDPQDLAQYLPHGGVQEILVE